jgi:hypothetical protein
MKRHLLALFMSLVVGGVSLADAADLSRAGGDWDEESSFEWVPAKLASFLPSMETESPSLIEQAGAVEDISTETSFVNHQRGCCTGIPCDWLTPCGGWTFEFQAAWLRLQGSAADRQSGDEYDSATVTSSSMPISNELVASHSAVRFTASWVRGCGGPSISKVLRRTINTVVRSVR